MKYDPELARSCLARAGFPGGRGLPKVAVLFNTSEDHRRIAEAIQQMWKRELGIQVELANQEWGSYLQATTQLQYDVARRSWIGDDLDPTTFLGLMRTGDGNNRTGWAIRATTRCCAPPPPSSTPRGACARSPPPSRCCSTSAR
jgi:oligopeptide transport system substrate-binding protein